MCDTEADSLINRDLLPSLVLFVLRGYAMWEASTMSVMGRVFPHLGKRRFAFGFAGIGLACRVEATSTGLLCLNRSPSAGAAGYAVEFTGEAISALDMAGRMTICNMAVEAGARAAVIAPDETVCAYLTGRDRVPSGSTWDEALAYWKTLATDEGAVFAQEVNLNASSIAPLVIGAHRQIKRCPFPALCLPLCRRLMSGRWTIWACRQARLCRLSPSTGHLLAHAPIRGLRICAVPPASCAEDSLRRASQRLLYPAPNRFVRRRKLKVWT